ncbi:MAG TPA: hypothetical protein VMT58_04495, partial [Candidatus Binataceae bacterium]|nr:hypothetical protein [Candidatus Binataceae bacterium]
MAASNRTFKAKEFAPEPPGRISFLARLGNGDPRVGVGLVAVLAVTAIAYFRALGNEFVGDDWDLIVNNGYLGNWSFIWTSMVNDVLWFHDPRHTPYSLYYRPMHDIWLAINFHLFKFNPIGWHAATVALYLIVVWLVFRVAARISGDNWTGLLAAALFGLMPIHAQAVAWPAAVCQPLVAAFELGAFELYLRWNGESHRTRDLAISLGLYAAALLTYESAVVFPLLIGVYAALFRSA